MQLPKWMRRAFRYDLRYLKRKRFYLQAGFAVLLNLSLAFTGFFALRWIGAPVLNCWACPYAIAGCPVGMIANFAALNIIAFGTIGILVSFGVILGRWTCGWVCPFGWFQELLYMIPTPKVLFPRILRYAKYLLLISMVIVIPWIYGGGTVEYEHIKPLEAEMGEESPFDEQDPFEDPFTEDEPFVEDEPEEPADTDVKSSDPEAFEKFMSKKMFFCYFCPAGALEASLPMLISTEPFQRRLDHLRDAEIRKAGLDPEFVADDDGEFPRITFPEPRLADVADKFIVLAIFIILFVLMKRPFCRLACPVGAILGIASKVSVLRLRVDHDRCIECDTCARVCPQGIAIYKDDCPSAECILCNECVNACPVRCIHYDNPLRFTKPVGIPDTKPVDEYDSAKLEAVSDEPQEQKSMTNR
ncbi:MAG: 4Fe-4S dicluster domain-containing protein [Planctomycetota bacterium]|nr:4Fe-4S dicluster domain-containing protein [Planctomycetota bacterium]